MKHLQYNLYQYGQGEVRWGKIVISTCGTYTKTFFFLLFLTNDFLFDVKLNFHEFKQITHCLIGNFAHDLIFCPWNILLHVVT